MRVIFHTGSVSIQRKSSRADTDQQSIAAFRLHGLPVWERQRCASINLFSGHMDVSSLSQFLGPLTDLSIDIRVVTTGVLRGVKHSTSFISCVQKSDLPGRNDVFQVRPVRSIAAEFFGIF